jgi:hypothetical protein
MNLLALRSIPTILIGIRSTFFLPKLQQSQIKSSFNRAAQQHMRQAKSMFLEFYRTNFCDT